MEEQSVNKDVFKGIKEKYNIKPKVLKHLINVLEFYNFSKSEINDLIEEYYSTKVTI